MHQNLSLGMWWILFWATLKKTLPSLVIHVGVGWGRGKTLYIFFSKHIIEKLNLVVCDGDVLRLGPDSRFFCSLLPPCTLRVHILFSGNWIKLLPASRVDTSLFRGEVGKEETNVLTATIIFSRAWSWRFERKPFVGAAGLVLVSGGALFWPFPSFCTKIMIARLAKINWNYC